MLTTLIMMAALLQSKAVITTWNGSLVPSTWPSGVPLNLSAEKSTVGLKPKSIRWIVKPAWSDQQSARSNDNKTISIATGVKPKTIEVTLEVSKDDEIDSSSLTIKVIPDPDEPTDIIPGPIPPGPGPTPPNPNPIPPNPVPPSPPNPVPPSPDIIPSGTKLHATIIYDETKETPASRKIRTNLDLATNLKNTYNTILRTYDVNSPDLLKYNFTNKIKEIGGAPCIIIQKDGVGQPLKAIALPASENEITALIKGFRG